MKKLFLIACVVLSSSVFAAAGEKGLGVMIGNPIGLNGKMWLDNGHAVDGGLGLSLGKHTNLSFHSDYLLQNDGAFFFNDVHSLDLYYGVGGRMEFGDDLEIGLRVPVGLVHKMSDQNADVFAEVAPIIDFIGRTGLEMSFGVGGRYYF